MSVELDLSRLDQVADVLGMSVPEIVAGILANLTEGLERLRADLEHGELELAATAAHACRNEVLHVGARPFLTALTELEEAARAGSLDAARAHERALDEVWPDTRAALAEVAARRE